MSLQRHVPPLPTLASTFSFRVGAFTVRSSNLRSGLRFPLLAVGITAVLGRCYAKGDGGLFADRRNSSLQGVFSE